MYFYPFLKQIYLNHVVRDFLIREGVSNSLIEVISYGEEKAASSGSNEDSWAMNRRVELK